MTILIQPPLSPLFNRIRIITIATGNNNAYEVNRKTDLAITYNDISVLENYHCALATKIIGECGLLAGLSGDEQTTFRKSESRQPIGKQKNR